MEYEGLYDLNLLYESFLRSMKGCGWKAEPQRFEEDFLSELVKLKDELKTKTYKTSDGTEFILNERGKIRYIHGSRVRDRVVRHAVCDYELTPKLDKYLIYNNGASRKGKGISFSRKIFERDLHNYWLQHRTNEGYILFIDLSKFYDNIDHAKVRELVYPHISDDAQWLLDIVLDSFRVDVSYMDDKQFADIDNWKFNSIDYHADIPDELKTGEKFLNRSVDIGDQVSQNLGIFFPTRIDNYCKIVRGCKYYGRYMDDIYIIHESKEELGSILNGIKEIADELHLFINDRKTHIVKLSGKYTYLQVKYSLSDTGKVIKRINPKSVTRERRRIKKYKHLLDEGIMSYFDIEQAVKSWMGGFAKLMSKKQINNMKKLYKDLFRKELVWKPKSSSKTEQKSK